MTDGKKYIAHVDGNVLVRCDMTLSGGKILLKSNKDNVFIVFRKLEDMEYFRGKLNRSYKSLICILKSRGNKNANKRTKR
jgi:hypothetical protein